MPTMFVSLQGSIAQNSPPQHTKGNQQRSVVTANMQLFTEALLILKKI